MAEEEIKVSGGMSLQLVPILKEKENWTPWKKAIKQYLALGGYVLLLTRHAATPARALYATDQIFNIIILNWID